MLPEAARYFEQLRLAGFPIDTSTGACRLRRLDGSQAMYLGDISNDPKTFERAARIGLHRTREILKDEEERRSISKQDVWQRRRVSTIRLIRNNRTISAAEFQFPPSPAAAFLNSAFTVVISFRGAQSPSIGNMLPIERHFLKCAHAKNL